MYDLGILGGMGPKATGTAFNRIIDYTLAQNDQEHISIVILNSTKIPDRTTAILKNETDIIDKIEDNFKIMEQLSVPVVIVTCNTSFYFIRKIKGPYSFTLIDAIEETTNYVKKTYKKELFCVMGTTGLVFSDVFCKNAGQDRIIYPDSSSQENIMNIITQIKSGADIMESALKMAEIMDKIQQKMKNVVFILACTEISLLRDYLTRNYVCVDTLDVMITQAIVKSGYRINEKPGQFLSNIEYFK